MLVLKLAASNLFDQISYKGRLHQVLANLTISSRLGKMPQSIDFDCACAQGSMTSEEKGSGATTTASRVGIVMAGHTALQGDLLRSSHTGKSEEGGGKNICTAGTCDPEEEQNGN
jgi:hypothetical protein